MSDSIKRRSVIVDDDEAESIIAETRHIQIQQSFNKLTNAILGSKSQESVVAAIQKQSIAIGGFVEVIKNIQPAKLEPIYNVPSSNTSSSSEELMLVINTLARQVVDGQISIKETLDRLIEEQCELKEWEFTINRGQGNMTKSVTAKQIK